MPVAAVKKGLPLSSFQSYVSAVLGETGHNCVTDAADSGTEADCFHLQYSQRGDCVTAAAVVMGQCCQQCVTAAAVSMGAHGCL